MRRRKTFEAITSFQPRQPRTLLSKLRTRTENRSVTSRLILRSLRKFAIASELKRPTTRETETPARARMASSYQPKSLKCITFQHLTDSMHCSPRNQQRLLSDPTQMLSQLHENPLGWFARHQTAKSPKFSLLTTQHIIWFTAVEIKP